MSTLQSHPYIRHSNQKKKKKSRQLGIVMISGWKMNYIVLNPTRPTASSMHFVIRRLPMAMATHYKIGNGKSEMAKCANLKMSFAISNWIYQWKLSLTPVECVRKIASITTIKYQRKYHLKFQQTQQNSKCTECQDLRYKLIKSKSISSFPTVCVFNSEIVQHHFD